MTKVKFTTRIDENLLKKIKIKAIEKNINVNEIIESLFKRYLGEEKEMTNSERLVDRKE